VRNRGIERGIKKTIAAIPTAATANSVVGGIRNSVAFGVAVRATAENVMAPSGIANLRWNRSAMLYLLGILDESRNGLLQ
jgi:hypothetical protein